MWTVIVHYDDDDKIFENVTKMEGNFLTDIFTSYLTIFQGDKKKQVKMCDVVGFEVVN